MACLDSNPRSPRHRNPMKRPQIGRNLGRVPLHYHKQHIRVDCFTAPRMKLGIPTRSVQQSTHRSRLSEQIRSRSTLNRSYKWQPTHFASVQKVKTSQLQNYGFIKKCKAFSRL